MSRSIRRAHPSFIVATAAWLTLVGAARATAADEPQNLARARPYTLTPAPNYWLTADADDARQLTDGTYTNWDPIWVKPSTVGWSNASHVTIVVDLQSIQPISGVSYSTAAGRADVQWPRSIFALVSDDGATFYPVGDLVPPIDGPASPPASGYAAFRFALNHLAVHGRYVALIVDAVGQYTFCDEVEVLAGVPTAAGAPVTGAGVTSLEDYFTKAHEASAIERRLRTDLAGARRALGAAAVDDALRATLAAALNDVEAAIPVEAAATPLSSRATLPLNASHARIFAVHGALARAAGRPALSAWAANPWDFATPLDQPPDSGGLDRVSIATMNGETRSGAISVANATETPLTVGVHIDGLPLDPDGGELDIFEAVWTDTRELIPVADALVPLARAAFDVPAGLTRQLWVRVRPRGRAAGVYRGTITLVARDGSAAQVPIELHVIDGQFPERAALHVGGWDYTNAAGTLGLTTNNVDPMIAALRDLDVDTPWATAQVMPYGGFDSAGRLAVTPDTSAFDAWVGKWQGAARFAVFVSAPDRIGSIGMDDTPRFAAAVADWIRFWAAHAAAIGIQPSQLMLLLVDEPHAEAQDDRIVRWASAIRAADSRIVLFEDPTYPDPPAARANLFDTVDVLALERSLIIERGQPFVEFYRGRHAQGQELAVYGASGPARLVDPYTYERLQAWLCADLGASSSFFWSFADDAGGHAWNEYATTDAPFSPLLLSDSEVTISKHSEAIREGTEDFEYLRMLGADPEGADARRAAVAAVLAAAGANDLQWTSPKDRSAADQTRVAIADALGLWNRTAIVATTIVGASSANPATFGEPLTLIASVSGADANGPAPTGTVQFVDAGGVVLGEATLAGSAAAIVTSSLGVGEHLLAITYGGDATHLPSRGGLVVTVTRATPPIAWRPPTAIAFGTALSDAQLNATAPIAGTFSYTPAAGTVPRAGRLDLSVTFTPADDAHYLAVTTTVSITVAPAVAALAAAATQVVYDARPHAATASVAGADGGPIDGAIAFTYEPGGTAPPVDTGTYIVHVAFTSRDPNYTNAALDSVLSIAPAVPALTVGDVAVDYDGRSHAVLPVVEGVNGPVPGSLAVTYGPGGTTAPTAPGRYTVTATFTSSTGNYTNATGIGSITIGPAPLTSTLLYPIADAADADLTQPLQWTAVFQAQAYYVYGGSTPGAKDMIDTGEIAATSYRVAVPPSGQTIYIRLWTKVAGVWRFTDSRFQAAPLVASLTSPAAGSSTVDLTLPLQWSSIPRAQAYYVWGGSTPGARDLADSGEISQTSYRIPNPPLTAQIIYVRLWTRTAGVWRYADSAFASAGIAATLAAPRDTATISQTTPLLEWPPVPSAQAYCVYLGTSVGARDLGNSGEIAETAYRASGLAAGQTVFVRLWTRVGGVWRSTDATFAIAAPQD